MHSFTALRQLSNICDIINSEQHKFIVEDKRHLFLQQPSRQLVNYFFLIHGQPKFHNQLYAVTYKSFQFQYLY